MAPVDDEDARHKREEAERRAKRKASKSAKSDSQLEKDRKRREHAQRVLQGQQARAKKAKHAESPKSAAETSVFESLFAQRSQGFQMEFAFRNAPPRPPVGPCFVGLGLEGKVLDSSRYRPLHTHVWKLHSEPDLGVPLAPSAMDLRCYKEKQSVEGGIVLHPDDEELLNWTGSLGDTAAEELKRRQDKARAAARLALMGKKVPSSLTAPSSMASSTLKKKKEFSRVLNETMQSWMKKTTYLSNDYSRKVHDFTSLAQTKQKVAEELEVKQAEIDLYRSGHAISKTFDGWSARLVHPTKPNLKPLSQLPILPNVQHWGNAYTHVVVDNPPKGNDPTDLASLLESAFVAHVEKKEANVRMSCQLLVPSGDGREPNQYRSIQQYDLDVIPLKEEDGPHTNFVLWVGETSAMYLPVSSRVQLSTGRPSKHPGNFITKRPLTKEERDEMEEAMAEVDADYAKQRPSGGAANYSLPVGNPSASTYNPTQMDEDDDDDDDDERFGASATIVAEG